MKKIVRFSGITLLAIFILFNCWIVLSGQNYFYKALYYNFANIDDYKIFPKRIIQHSASPKEWSISKSYNKINISDSLRKNLDGIETVALLIIKKDSIQFEEYWDGYNKDSYSNSFSVAKSYVSALIGIALQDSLIKSIDQPICDFIPEFCTTEKKKITIKHLLAMSSGLGWDEGYSAPLAPTTEAYYGSDLRTLVTTLEPVEAPGKIFRYKSCDTQLLSYVLEKATGKQISQYAQEKLWEPLGCTNSAIWSLDKENGDEKAFCCINSNARDFARLGKLYLDSGNLNGKQILPIDYYLSSLQPTGMPDGDLNMKNNDFYGYQWWVMPNYKNHYIFYARGILGQTIIVIPKLKTIIVRLGKRRGIKIDKHCQETYALIDEALSR